ncbi:MAG: protein rep [Gemmatimonadetes bacterium]|nr:protein rep [Gemmatimonadota bacterium]
MRRVVEWHTASGGSLLLLSLTVRHGLGDDLTRTRAGVAQAWRRVQAGEPWQRFKRRYRMRGAIRSMEVTAGPNGFHPHLHVLLFLDRLSSNDLNAARLFIAERWSRAVALSLGEAAVPDAVHGCDLRPCADASYLTKLGLSMELVAPAGKLGRSSSRSLFQVAADFLQTGDESDALLWQAYCRGMKGARLLTWTRGLREAAGIGVERTDKEIVDGTEDVEEAVYTFSGWEWDSCRDRPGLKYLVLEAAEQGGAEAVLRVIHESRRVPH